MDILVLYSWEVERQKEEEAKAWAMGLCYELCRYMDVTASCDMLFLPKSDVLDDLSKRIRQAEKILVIVTNSYNEKIERCSGVASFEEGEYSKRIKHEIGTNNILFVKKESNIGLPKGWEGYSNLDFSWINKNTFCRVSPDQRKKRFDKIIRFFSGTPEYIIEPIEKKFTLPVSEKVMSFEELYAHEHIPTYHEQETSLINLIKKNTDQESFIFEYIRSGLSADINLGGRMTPDVFIKNFLVKRPPIMERKYNATVGQLFSDRLHNMLCVQSDGGSGKSVFLHTLYARDEKNGSKYTYRNTIIDLSNLHKNFASKEDLLFQRLKKEYKHMSKDSTNDINYTKQWRKAFSDYLNELKSVAFPDSPDMFMLLNFQEKINEAIDSLLPEDGFEDWYIGYSKRIHSLKNNQKENLNILFVILLLFYTIILISRPKRGKDERFIIVFDNIETYDSGDNTQRIAEYINSCHGFLETIFDELGKRDDFFTKFSFIIVLRTSTLVFFGSRHTNIWCGNKYIVHLQYSDFSVEALLKKLKFLRKIKKIEATTLYRELYNIVSLLIPVETINKYLQSEEDVDLKLRFFASNQLLPMFNNNFRNAMEYLYQAYFSEKYHGAIVETLNNLSSTNSLVYDYSINGIRMMVFRYIFDEFRTYGYFNDIGFPDLSGIEDHSMSRLILAYIYWDNVKYYARNNSNQGYKGVSLVQLVDSFKYFCEEKRLSSILFGLSIYTSKKPEKKAALNAWGNLLIFENCEEVIDEETISKLVQSCINRKADRNTKRITIRLSDAGQCFTKYYIRSFEFLEARNQRHEELSALFLLSGSEEIKTCLTDIREIIRNCITKLINGCKQSCLLYCGKNHECVIKEKSCAEYKLFSCSLFLRYQECLDFIRESIDYIDRYRIVLAIRTNNLEVNDMLLIQITEYYKLYDEVKRELCESPENQARKFIENWAYDSNKVLNEASKRYNASERTRLIQSYYARSDENFVRAVEIVKQEPRKSIFNVIMEMSEKQEE